MNTSSRFLSPEGVVPQTCPRFVFLALGGSHRLVVGDGRLFNLFRCRSSCPASHCSLDNATARISPPAGSLAIDPGDQVSRQRQAHLALGPRHTKHAANLPTFSKHTST